MNLGQAVKESNRHYFVTTKINGAELARKIHKAQSQSKAVMELFEKYYLLSLTAEEVFNYLRNHNRISVKTPKDSIKRAISVLKSEGKLIRLEETKVGEHGDPIHFYAIAQYQTKINELDFEE